MSLVKVGDFVSNLCPPADKCLVERLVEEFVSVERRFVLRDWEPAELDGGQFAEILAKIYHHLDSGNLSPNRDFNGCLNYVEDDQNPHNILPRHDALHVAKVLRTLYKFRSQRGAVHISATYQANHMDA